MFYSYYNTAGYFWEDYSKISGVELNDIIFAWYYFFIFKNNILFILKLKISIMIKKVGTYNDTYHIYSMFLHWI